MEFKTTEGGLVIPAKQDPPPDEEPTRKFGLLEIRDPEYRTKAEEALSRLWDAMDLSSGRDGLLDPRCGIHDAYYEMWHAMAVALLGRNHNCEKEMCT